MGKIPQSVTDLDPIDTKCVTSRDGREDRPIDRDSNGLERIELIRSISVIYEIMVCFHH